MHWWTYRSVRAKLLVAFLVLGLVPLAVMSVVAERGADAIHREAAGRRLEDVAFNTIDKLDRSLADRYAEIQTFASSAPARSMDAGRLSEWIDALVILHAPVYRLIAVASQDGRIVAVSGVDAHGQALPATQRLLGLDVSREAWFRDAMSGSVKDGASLVDDLHRDRLLATVYGDQNSADLGLSFTAPIKDADGRIVGIWTNRVNWDIVAAIASDSAARARAVGMTTVELGLASPGGTILVGPNPADVLRGSYAGRTGVGTGDDGAAGYRLGTALGDGTSAYQGWARSAGYGTFPGLGWTVLATQAEDDVLAPLRDLRSVMLLTAALAAWAIIAGAWTVSGPIVKAVGQVSRAARGLSRGDLDQQIDHRSGDEIGQMAEAMRAMIAYQ
jgi:HAMP domain-containing protein